MWGLVKSWQNCPPNHLYPHFDLFWIKQNWCVLKAEFSHLGARGELGHCPAPWDQNWAGRGHCPAQAAGAPSTCLGNGKRLSEQCFCHGPLQGSRWVSIAPSLCTPGRPGTKQFLLLSDCWRGTACAWLGAWQTGKHQGARWWRNFVPATWPAFF